MASFTSISRLLEGAGKQGNVAPVKFVIVVGERDMSKPNVRPNFPNPKANMANANSNTTCTSNGSRSTTTTSTTTSNTR